MADDAAMQAADTARSPVPDMALARHWLPIVLLGIGGGCISALQPVLLDLLAKAGRLTAPEMGTAAMAEAAGMTLATTLAAFFLPLRGLKLKAVIALGVMCAANAATTMAWGDQIVLLRFMQGCGAGVLLWILVGLFAASPAPARIFGIYVTGQSAFALLLSIGMTKLIVPQYGFAGGYLSLCAFNLLLLIAAAMVPAVLGSRPSGFLGVPRGRALVTLIAITCFLGGILALWVYMVPLLQQWGRPATAVANAVPFALGGQIAGGLAATMLASRLSPMRAWVGGTVLMLAAIALLWAGTTPVVLLAASAAIGFLWIFVPPFHMPVLLAMDPDGPAPMLLGTAQLAGTSVGPLLASRLVTKTDVSGSLTAAISLLVVTLVLLALLGGRGRPAQA